MGAVPQVATGADAADAIAEHGCAIVGGVLDRRTCAELDQAVTALEAGHPLGRNVFEGERSHRLYSLIARGRPFEHLAEHPVATEVLDRLLQPNWLLSNCQSIRLHPGETHQPWHTDDVFYLVPRPRSAPLGISTIWAISDFTAENGATEVLPRGHRWGEDHPDDHPDAEVAVAEMPAGSVLIFDAALWHRGGANHTQGTRLCLTNQYCQPWLRPQESQLLIAPPAIAAGMSDRVRSMLGYSIHPPFVGQVEGKHPLRLVDEDAYRANRGDDAERAERILRRPDHRFTER
jgi:ectoine hydroxylase-related dioxygenase (phytanoyl-CoA dioxygenase family)